MTHIKKYIDSLQKSVGLHRVNVRLNVLEKVWEEYNDAQDQLEYNDDDDDDETQQYEFDRDAFRETYYELSARIDRIISDDRRARSVSSADSRASGAPHETNSPKGSEFDGVIDWLILRSSNEERETPQRMAKCLTYQNLIPNRDLNQGRVRRMWLSLSWF